MFPSWTCVTLVLEKSGDVFRPCSVTQGVGSRVASACWLEKWNLELGAVPGVVVETFASLAVL